MQKFVYLLATLLFMPALRAQESLFPGHYEVVKDMPVFYEQLKSTLTYPMAWGNSKQTDFSSWRKEARQTLFDCLSPTPPTIDFVPQTIIEEKREGYTAKK